MAKLRFDVPQNRRVDRAVPAALRPLVLAYVLGYASSTTPRLLTLLLTHLGRKRTNLVSFRASLFFILKSGFEWQRFPTFCAALIGGSTLLQIPLQKLFAQFAESLSQVVKERLTRWLSAFIAAWWSLKLLQSKESDAFIDKAPSTSGADDVVAIKSTKFAGRTMDLTLFAVIRAVDVLFGELWEQQKLRKKGTGHWTRLDTAISNLTDPAIFATSSALIMWAWIYLPDRLPRAYNKWIATAAVVDNRLIRALRAARWGELQYGKETGAASILQPMCTDYNWPQIWGDPAQTIPFPCEMVHMGSGTNCEFSIACRFGAAFKWAMATYLPLNLALQLRRPSSKGARRALISALRSSSFLSSFIALFYYGVCLSRTRLPQLYTALTKSTIPLHVRQNIDSGLCIAAGCVLCGWSLMLENASRRKDIALFVAPRALATLLPRRYGKASEWRENVAFAVSTAVVFTCVGERPERVRGVFGRILKRVLS